MANKNYYSSEENTSVTKKLLIFLWSALAVVVAVGVVLFVINFSAMQKDNAVTAKIAEETGLSANVFIAVEDDDNDGITPQFLLVGLNSSAASVTVLELPGEMEITGAEKTDTMYNLYDYGDVQYLKSAVENHFRITIQKYIGCTMSEVETVVDKLGGVEYNIPKKMQQTNAEGSLVTNLIKGIQNLNGNQYCQYLRYDAWKSVSQKAQKRADLFISLINEYANDIEPDKIISVYNSVANKLDTDVSAIDINNFSNSFSDFQKHDNPAKIASVDYKSKKYDVLKIEKFFG